MERLKEESLTLVLCLDLDYLGDIHTKSSIPRRVKEEPDCDGVSEAAASDDLYFGHEVKEELVLGPEVLQPPDVAFAWRSQVRDRETPVSFKIATGGPDCSASLGHPITGDAVKLEVCAEEPPMVWIHSPFDEFPKTNYRGEPATEPTAPPDPQRSQKTEIHRALNIKPCYIPLVRIDSATRNERVKENKSTIEKTIKRKKFFCDFCGKGFALKQSLQVHIRIHTGEKPYSCRVCTKKFSDLSILIRHRRIHTGEKPHICDVCEKQFSEKYLLKYHKRLHTGDTPYACQHCPKTFNHISNLKRHTRQHENKPFICEICNVHFAVQSKLETHLLSHLKDKPFACDVCSKCFTNSGNLNRHLKIHFEVKKYLYNCKVCKARFSQLGSLKRHVSRKICGIR